MPRILIDLNNEEVREVLNRTKKNLKEGVEGIVREFLKEGKSLGDLAGSERFRRLLDEALNAHFSRFLKELSKGIRVEEVQGAGVDREDVERIVRELLKEELEVELAGLEERFKKLRDGLIKEIDRLKAVVDRDIESIASITQKLEKEIEKEVLERLKEMEKVSQELKEKQQMITALFIDSVLTKLAEIYKGIENLQTTYQRLASFVGYKDLSCAGVHHKEGRDEK